HLLAPGEPGQEREHEPWRRPAARDRGSARPSTSRADGSHRSGLPSLGNLGKRARGLVGWVELSTPRRELNERSAPKTRATWGRDAEIPAPQFQIPNNDVF